MPTAPTKRTYRLSPYQVGYQLARTTGSLKGLPYGPGTRQQEALAGFNDFVAFAQGEDR